MDILRVAQKCYPDVVGGGPYHVHALSRDQAAMGHDVTVLTVGDGPATETRDGYTVVRYPSRGSLLGNDVAPGVWQHLRSGPSVDVVHAHSHLYFSTNLAAVARRLGSTPLAITNHGLYSQTAPEWLFDWYLRTAGRWTFDAADVVFCYTEADESRLRRRGVSAPVSVVPNGVDTSRFRPDGPTHDAVSGSPSLLFVGRLVEGKQPLVALDAFEAVQETHPDATLTVCGTGPLRSDMAAAADRRGLSAAVRFLGHVPYDEMPAVYRSADLLLLPSRAEGFPRTVLEALASDVPVVVSDLPQVRPVVLGGGGRTAPVGDATAFAEASRAVLSDETLDPAGVVTDRFDWSTTVESTTARLRSLTT